MKKTPKGRLYNFIRGMGSILQIYPETTHQEFIYQGLKTDRDQLAADWKSIGNDFKSLLNNGSKKRL